MTEKILLALNKCFKKPVHPFNLRNEGVQSYAMWQYERGADTIAFFLRKYTMEEMFQGKTVLDIGCGAGGKTLYYAARGASRVIGMDVVEGYRAEAEELAVKLGREDVFTFLCRDAADTGLEGESVDTIVMNDAMEHVARPEAVLAECARVLKKGGRLYVNFPPYGHPYGAHLSDLVSIPWVHVLFGDETLIGAYKKLAGTVPDGAERIAFRIGTDEDGREYFSYINKMTLKRFRNIRETAPLRVEYYSEEPLRPFLKIPARWPVLREYLVKMAVCVFVKD